MSFHMARVAPKKAVFRPALPLCFQPGITEMQMSKTYFEKLKDPRWQKKRLEVLEQGDWSCEQCGDTDSTLHVHHRQYFKGRDPWDYEVGQLTVLCEGCHSSTHESDDFLLLAASFVVGDGPFNRDAAASLIAGFCQQGMAKPYVGNPDAYVAGEVAYALTNKAQVLQLVELRNALDGLDRNTVREAIESFIADLKSRPTANQPALPIGFDL